MAVSKFQEDRFINISDPKSFLENIFAKSIDVLDREDIDNFNYKQGTMLVIRRGIETINFNWQGHEIIITFSEYELKDNEFKIIIEAKSLLSEPIIVAHDINLGKKLGLHPIMF